MEDLSITLGEDQGATTGGRVAALVIPGWELWVTTSRASGPGGQHVNKTNSRVTLHWSIGQSSVLSMEQKARLTHRLASHINAEGVLTLSVDSERSQLRNRDIARERLAEWVCKGLARRKRRVATRPSRAAKRRRLEGKRRRSDTKKMRGKVDRPDP